MTPMSDREFRMLSDFIRKRSGIELKPEKRAMLAGRLQQRLSARGLDRYVDYYHIVSSGDEAEISRMLDCVTTNYTYFMREKEHFSFFRETVLPEAIARARDRDLRVWSAACATGEEPYTLAMLIDEHFAGMKKGWDTRLLATDISRQALAAAQTGMYGEERIEELPERWKKRYFQPAGAGQYRLNDRLRAEVVFRQLNLTAGEFPFKRRFHAIFCRNVMIYFDARVRRALIGRLADWLEPGGYLFVGHSESLVEGHPGLRYVKPSVYRKLGS
ncbi:protein-glutamate O-methyltransferase CheR [Paenibacillus spiritus]|uniref:protein-glutamate O-methyltransferase n=1 Tax=Paenibacillus spiritus TaxID=2496557 RepID=A0A5J5G897_9BACL|nr:protein-glutamate O-methyltransferase CheR [Paenibacillus spiritus]KAA9003968.1 protein-glutamate O-methyltransferase CheR [Paenibacillus spiritus]